MEVVQILYCVPLAIGALMLLMSLVGVEFDSDADGVLLLSQLSLAAGFVGFGATGLVVDWAGSPVPSLSAALPIGAFAYVLGGMLKTVLKKGEHNSHLSSEDFKEYFATVMWEVEPNGYTEVQSIEHGTVRVRNGWNVTLEKGCLVVVRRNDEGNGLLIFPTES